MISFLCVLNLIGTITLLQFIGLYGLNMYIRALLSVGCEINHNRRSKGYDSNNRETCRTVLVCLKGTPSVYKYKMF
jgi:hypothetical protein